jgi:hypothetical protein
LVARTAAWGAERSWRLADGCFLAEQKTAEPDDGLLRSSFSTATQVPASTPAPMAKRWPGRLLESVLYANRASNLRRLRTSSRCANPDQLAGPANVAAIGGERQSLDWSAHAHRTPEHVAAA